MPLGKYLTLLMSKRNKIQSIFIRACCTKLIKTIQHYCHGHTKCYAMHWQIICTRVQFYVITSLAANYAAIVCSCASRTTCMKLKKKNRFLSPLLRLFFLNWKGTSKSEFLSSVHFHADFFPFGSSPTLHTLSQKKQCPNIQSRSVLLPEGQVRQFPQISRRL